MLEEEDEHLRHDVRQHIAKEPPQKRNARHVGVAHIPLLALRAHDRARDACILRPRRDEDGEDDVADVRPQEAEERDEEDAARESEEEVDDPRRDELQPSARQRHRRADADAEDRREDAARDRCRKACLTADEDAREKVAPELVRAEEVLRRRRQEACAHVVRIGVVGEERRHGEHRGDPQEEERCEHAEERVAPHAREEEPHVSPPPVRALWDSATGRGCPPRG